MTIKYKLFVAAYFALLVAGLASCDPLDTISIGEPRVFSIQSDTINKRQTITIQGENLGAMPNNAYVLIDDYIKIVPDSLESWNNSKIEFLPPQDTGKHTIRIVLGKDTTNSLAYYLRHHRLIEMVTVPKGEFQMGSVIGHLNERPVHRVVFSKDILIAKYEVSQAIWLDLNDDNPSIDIDESKPVHNLSWLDAVLFCNKLSRAEGLAECYQINGDEVSFDYDASGYRLPTEAEWEYSCRAGTDSDYNNEGELNPVGWFIDNSAGFLHPVGKLLPNSYGIYDMHGNAWEYVWDYYSSDAYASAIETNPTGPTAGDRRIVRGGAYNSGNALCRSTNRTMPDDVKSAAGIRLVKNK